MNNKVFLPLLLLFGGLLLADDIRLRRANRTMLIERDLAMAEVDALRQDREAPRRRQAERSERSERSERAERPSRNRSEPPPMQPAGEDTGRANSRPSPADRGPGRERSERGASVEQQRWVTIQDTIDAFAEDRYLPPEIQDEIYAIMEEAAAAKKEVIALSREENLSREEMQAEFELVRDDIETQLHDLLGQQQAEQFIDELRASGGKPPPR